MLHVIVFFTAGHRFAWVYRPGQERLVLRSLGRTAARADLPFTWGDAAVLTKQVRRNAARVA